MRKLINDIPSIVRQSLEGLAALHPGLALLGNQNTLVRADLAAAAAPARRHRGVIVERAYCGTFLTASPGRRADAGDHTMLDALIPAATAMTTGSIADQLDAAAQAARDGAAGTAAMQSRRGRSSYIGDRALGHPDPGAVAVAMWLEAAARAARQAGA